MTQESMEPKKLALLRILEIFQRYSDEDHHLKQEDIITYLERDYALSLERKAISRNISLLKEAGYEISSDRSGSWLANRDFDSIELRILIDSVLSSRFLSVERSKAMIEKLCKQNSIYFRSNVKHIHAVNEWNKVENPELFRNIELICDAIERKKVIQYTSLNYGKDKKLHKGEEYISTPCGIFISGQTYHLLEIRGSGEWNHPGKQMKVPPPAYAQPIWKMSDIRIMENEPPRNLALIEEFGNHPNIPKIIQEHAITSQGAVINSWFHKVMRFTIACPESCLNDIIESFGDNIRILNMSNFDKSPFVVREIYKIFGSVGRYRYFNDMVKVSFLATEEAVISFVMQHAPDTCILSPEKSRKKYEDRLQFMISAQQRISEELLRK